jgi:hypothetical protein
MTHFYFPYTIRRWFVISFFLPSQICFFFPAYICKTTRFGEGRRKALDLCCWVVFSNKQWLSPKSLLLQQQLSLTYSMSFFHFVLYLMLLFCTFFTFTCRIMILGAELHLGSVGFLFEITHVKFCTIPCLNAICFQNMCTLMIRCVIFSSSSSL